MRGTAIAGAALTGAVLAGAAIAAPHVAGPPPGHTGGFGEPTCAVCHTGSAINEPGSTLEVVGIGGTYRPGHTYEITVRLLSFDMHAAGFQAAFRWAEGADRGRNAGQLAAGGGAVEVVESPDGVSYAQHAAGGAKADGQTGEWSFEWTAPERPGSVALHVAANSGNGDNSPLDDLVYTLATTLEAAAPSR